MLGIHCVGVSECQSEDPFVCFGVKPTQRACAQDLPRDRKRTREGKVPEQNRPGNRSRRKPTARIYGSRGQVGQRERMSQHSWWLCRNFTLIHARDSSQMHRKLCESVTHFSLLALGANPSPCLLVLFSLSVVYVVFCGFVKICEIPLARNKRNY